MGHAVEEGWSRVLGQSWVEFVSVWIIPTVIPEKPVCQSSVGCKSTESVSCRGATMFLGIAMITVSHTPVMEMIGV